MPKLLFRYFGSHAFESLRDCELMTSRIERLNDPLEFKYRVTGTMTHRRCLALICRFSKKPKSYWRNNPAQLEAEIAELRKCQRGFAEAAEPEKLKLSRDYRVVCFSSATVSKKSEILLWSHYANKHAGVRIGFTFPANLRDPFRLYKVKYRKLRVQLDATIGADGIDHMKKVFEECQYRKSSAWNYECEYRGISHLTEVKGREQRRIKVMGDRRWELFLKIDPSWVRYVDFGLNCPKKEKSRLIKLLKHDYPHVICRQAKPHESAYALTYDPI